MKKVIELLFVLTCLLAIPLSAQAHKARYHSIFIYNFCKYIEWPEGETDKIIRLCSKKHIKCLLFVLKPGGVRC
jgi:hypothetical protein